MSSLIPSGSASGTGSMTLSAPVTNSNQTATLPDATGTVMVSGNMPAFAANAGSSTSISNGVFTVAPYNTKVFDTGTCYNNTNGTVTLNGISTPAYAFAPNVAGYYQISATASVYGNSTTTGSTQIALRFNGSNLSFATCPIVGSQQNVQFLAGVFYFNGTSDYIQTFMYQSYGSTLNFDTGNLRFSGSMIRSA